MMTSQIPCTIAAENGNYIIIKCSLKNKIVAVFGDYRE